MSDPWRGPGFIVDDEVLKDSTIQELPGPNGTNEYVLECIGNMHKVMKDGWCYEKKYRATKKLPDGSWDPHSTEEYLEKSDHADIYSGEGCTVVLWKDKCEVWNDYNRTYVEVDPQSFYKMMCDWEEAIHKWEKGRVEMMIEEKKRPYFREYFERMSQYDLESMLRREKEIAKEEAEKRQVAEEEIRKLLKTEVLEKIYENEKRKNEIAYAKWITEKEKLVDDYLGVKKEEEKNVEQIQDKPKQKSLLQRIFGK